MLWLRVAIPFLVFVVTGTLGIFWFLHITYQRRSADEFAQLAQSNAEFIRSIHLPANDRFSAYLSNVLGMRVLFARQAGDVPKLDPRQDAATAVIEPGLDLVLIRDKPSLASLLMRPPSIVVMCAFWVLSFALAGAIARGVVHPYIETRQRLAEAERLAMLGKMATALAHEVQNPVAAIRLHAQLMDSAPPSERAAAIAGSLPTVLSETDRIENLVNQWLFIAKPHPPQTTVVVLRDILAGVVQALRPMADHARVQVAADLPATLATTADSRRLRQAFGNLVTNAIQAMPGGGTLRITGRTESDAVVIEFTDTGRGFSVEALRRCPELFYSEKEGGMGIGLAVAHEIARAHGGRLDIANTPTGGANVSVRLPATEIAS